MMIYTTLMFYYPNFGNMTKGSLDCIINCSWPLRIDIHSASVIATPATPTPITIIQNR